MTCARLNCTAFYPVTCYDFMDFIAFCKHGPSSTGGTVSPHAMIGTACSCRRAGRGARGHPTLAMQLPSCCAPRVGTGWSPCLRDLEFPKVRRPTQLLAIYDIGHISINIYSNSLCNILIHNIMLLYIYDVCIVNTDASQSHVESARSKPAVLGCGMVLVR